MRILAASAALEEFPLTRPYAIAQQEPTTRVDNVIVRLEALSGPIGWGAASPAEGVTGETVAACREALSPERLAWLAGRDVRALPALCRELRERMPATPAARAAVDMALHDLLAQHLGVPLVEMLGRAHEALPTSITIGIKPLDETLAEAEEYLGRGFRVLKVKTGDALEEDLERLARLRERCGSGVTIRADANQGYTAAETVRFFERTAPLAIEFVEQPVPRAQFGELARALGPEERRRVAADESLHDEADALMLASPEPACGIFNIKLMKSGGIDSARRIASVAETAGIALMWGCMDESRIGIAAALHAAFSSPATRYLDLDGSLDLARDVAEGGFTLVDGVMRTTETPGLGVVVES
ncbi:MAG TPA: dipeptide epimerase [Thermoanaerobaculia bacterium]|jgi:L-alanine-DL-glutamate epimerase-like enolase superfamily enzyme